MNKSSLVKLNAVIAVMVLAMCLAVTQIPRASSELQKSPENKADAVTFLREVMDLDMAVYTAKLDNVMNTASDEQWEKYTLNATDGAVQALCMIKDGAVVSCLLSPLSGTKIVFAHATAGVKNQVNRILDKYINYSSVPHVQSMLNTISAYDLTKSMEVQVGNARLEVRNTAGDDSQTIAWVRAPKGIANTYDEVILTYKNGGLTGFTDLWNRLQIGSFDVNVLQAEAVQVAKDAARNYSFTYDNITISNFSLAETDDAVHTELTMQPKEDDALYPIWSISLGLDRTYAGGISELQVLVWADTGQVARVNWVGGYGFSTNAINSNTFDSLTTSNASPQYQAENNASLVNGAFVIIGAVSAIMVAIVAVTIVVRKRSK
jgi:hypothetical protein